MLEDWTTTPCPIIHHFGGMLNNLPGCPIFLHFDGRLDKNPVQGSSILAEPWTIAKLYTFPVFAGKLDNCALANLSVFWRKPGQLSKLSDLPAFWKKIRQLHLFLLSIILEEG